MDRHGSKETQSDQPTDWEAQEGETRLEEPMWQLGLGEEAYPERPGEPDCIYYLRTGCCGYGDCCRFNHPRQRPQVTGDGRNNGRDYREGTGRPVCQYYVKTGTCKFGSTCKYHHPRQGVGSSPLNIYGYPLRPGEKECSYYMKAGQCKFGITCKFHHPQPANVQGPTAAPAAVPPAPVASATVFPQVQNLFTAAPASQQYGVVTGNWPLIRPHVMPGSYIQGPYGSFLLPPGVLSLPTGWAPYAVPSPETMPGNQSAMGASELYGINLLSPSAPAYAGVYSVVSSSSGPSNSSSKEHSFPQRPGQSECQYYLKTGECKFGTSCKYHHPVKYTVPEASSVLNSMGLPLHTGTPICSNYAQRGVCKFGPTCKFDHPMGTLSYSPSASSLSDMPVAPYPVGSSVGALAPSSSSSDLRAEVVSRSFKEPPPIMSSTMTISSGTCGSVLSKSGSISQYGAQQSGQAPSTSSIDSSVQGGAPN